MDPAGRLSACAILLLVAAGCGSGAPAPTLKTASVLHSLARCPARFPQRPFGSVGGGLADRLVPAGARRARLCVYAALNPRPHRYGRLVAQRVVTDRRILARAAAKLNALPAPRPGPSTCPGMPRTPFVVVFGYAHRPPVTVTVYVDKTCFLVSNGRKVADASYVSAAPVLRLLRHG